MISVGSRDEKKLSLVYGFKGEKMELENEIEEGEALFQNNHNNYGHNYDDDDDDSRIDPDVSLSYIDEKIQDVLGDCQKEFEGGVSAENLGAKYGGYGSFLPTYQRSPVCSHPKTPQKVATYSAPVSPNNAHIEVGHQNPISQSSASQPPRNGPKSKSNNKSKQEARSSSGEKSKSATDSDPKSLKVRLKVGSDNLSIKKKAEILSGLGLDVSPSSSLEASPVDSNGFFHTGQNGPDESPTSILEMMTSFPISGNLLLSPLPYDVLHLTEKKLEDGSCGPAHKGSQESTVTALHGSDLVKVDQNALQEKSKSKSDEKNSASMESTNGDDIHNTIDVKPKKETSVDRLTVGNKTSSSSGIKNESFSSKNKNKSKGSKGYNVKVKETYKDFFGELDLDHEDHDFEKPSEGNNVKSTPEYNLSKERLNGKKSQQLSSSTMGTGVLSDVVVPMAVPVVNEDWVCCDKCEKWRLLPPGVNPGSLPEKWLCSMLDWLPGMNSCSISEEETTKAITTRFPGPSVPSGPHITATSLNGTHQQHLGSSQFPSSNIKKKHGLKDLPISEVKQERPSTSSNSSKKNLYKSHKTRSLNDANNSPFFNEVEFQDSGHSRDVIVEKEKLKQKVNNNNKLRENIADGGAKTHHPKINNKRESIQDISEDRKKLKIDDKNGGKIDKKDVSKKRKSVNEIDGNTNKYTKEKKPRVVKSFDKDIPATKHKIIEDVKLVDSSSSSKVSGSHKTKNINQETKGSPVESVSSSPMRILNVKPVDQPLTKNISTRINEEKSKRHKSQGKFAKGSVSKELPLHKKVKIDAISSQDSKKPVKKDASIKGKSTSLPPKGQIEIENKENGGNNMQLKELKPNKKSQSQSQNGSQPLNVKDSSVNKQKGKIPDSTGVVLVRDLSNQATTNALREATNLKHMADRVKNGGSSLESRALYLQAALKFLHVASLFESCHSQTGRYGDMIQSLSIYSSTAKLCEYCAHEYERTKEMSTTSLAYKCMEVAYMKVIFSSHSTNCKDVNELQTSLPTGPTGESPCSSASASDLDNLTKGVNASQVAGNHVIPAKNKPNFTRILNFAQDVNSAMEASRRSRTAFAASNSKDETVKSAIKKALDFNFHDVEGFLHLVRIAMEVINR